MKVSLPKDINKTQRKITLRSWITLLIGAAVLLGLFFLLQLLGFLLIPRLLFCCVLAVPVSLLAVGTQSHMARHHLQCQSATVPKEGLTRR